MPMSQRRLRGVGAVLTVTVTIVTIALDVSFWRVEESTPD